MNKELAKLAVKGMIMPAVIFTGANMVGVHELIIEPQSAWPTPTFTIAAPNASFIEPFSYIVINEAKPIVVKTDVSQLMVGSGSTIGYVMLS